MPGSPNQKMKIVYLMKIMLEQTDEDHPLTIQEILDKLSEGETAKAPSVCGGQDESYQRERVLQYRRNSRRDY
jgi:hypothetical protein